LLNIKIISSAHFGAVFAFFQMILLKVLRKCSF